VPFEKETIDYGARQQEQPRAQGLGDPLGVDKHTRPTTKSIAKWVEALAVDPAKASMMRETIARLNPADLALLGYPVGALWKPLDEYSGTPTPRHEPRNAYRVQRQLIMGLRTAVRRNGVLRRAVEATRRACTGILRD
jgi:hypothetical protein